MPVTASDMLCEFSDKAATLGLQVNDIFDEQFNWVTDQSCSPDVTRRVRSW